MSSSDLALCWALSLYPNASRRRRVGGAKKKKKSTRNKRDGWYPSLTVDKLKELCKAANISPTGNKAELVERLTNNEHAGAFTFERTGKYSLVGVNLQDIKVMCRSKSLPVSGSRYELVLRLLHHASGTTAPKKATTTAAAKKPKAARTEIVYNQIHRKIKAGFSSKLYDSHWGAKQHAEDVYKLMNESLTKEVLLKSLEITKPKYALDIAKAVFTCLNDHYKSISSHGRDMGGEMETAFEHLAHIVQAALPGLSHEEIEDTIEWLEELSSITKPYGLGGNAETGPDELIEMLQAADKPKDSSDDDDDDSSFELEDDASTANKKVVLVSPKVGPDTSKAGSSNKIPVSSGAKENQAPKVNIKTAPSTAKAPLSSNAKKHQAPEINSKTAATKVPLLSDSSSKENEVPQISA